MFFSASSWKVELSLALGQQAASCARSTWLYDVLTHFIHRWQAVINGVQKGVVSAQLTSSWLSRVEALWKNNSQIQQIALKGLYHVVNGNLSESFLAWTRLRDRSGVEYDGSVFHFEYKRLARTSDVALFRILTSALLQHSDANFTDSVRQDLIDHWVSQKIVLLSLATCSSWVGPSPHRKMGPMGHMAPRTASSRGVPGIEGWASGWAEGDAVDVCGGLNCVSTAPTFLATIALGSCCLMAFEVSLWSLR